MGGLIGHRCDVKRGPGRPCNLPGTGASRVSRVNVNATHATTGATALLQPAQYTPAGVPAPPGLFTGTDVSTGTGTQCMFLDEHDVVTATTARAAAPDQQHACVVPAARRTSTRAHRRGAAAERRTCSLGA